MLSQIKAYLAVILATLLLTVCGYAYYTHKENVQLSLDVATYRKASEDNLAAKEASDASCLITVDALASHYREQSKLEASQKATGDAVLALPTLTIKEKANAAPTKPQGFADDDRLSPDLMRLLDNAYCDGDKDHCASPTK